MNKKNKIIDEKKDSIVETINEENNENTKPKKVSKHKRLKIVLISIASILFLFIGIISLGIYAYLNDYAPEQSKSLNKSITSIAYNNSSSSNNKKKQNNKNNSNKTSTSNNKDTKKSNSSEGTYYYSKNINWKSVKKVSNNIVAWINIKNTPINYPILYKKNDKPTDPYYLYRNYKNEYDMYGSIYINVASKQGLNSKNVILMGHNMDDGSMFHSLTNYGSMKGNLNFYKSSPTISIKHNGKKDIYKIISIMKIDSNSKSFNSLVGEFYSSAEFMNYIYQVKARSLINTDVNVNENDSLVTLSTCSYEYKDFRTVVVARKVRKGESVSVNTQNASLNKEILYPNICYKSDKSLKKPKMTTFMNEYKKNKDNVKWYDGSGKISGGETIY